MFDVEEIKESIMLDNGKSMTETRVRNLKYRVPYAYGSELDITLHEIKLFPELWVNLFSINKESKNVNYLSNKGM
jgi:hypothetical protein